MSDVLHLTFVEGCVCMLKYHPLMAVSASTAQPTCSGPLMCPDLACWPIPYFCRSPPASGVVALQDCQTLPHPHQACNQLPCALQPVAPYIDRVLEPLARRGFYASATSPGAHGKPCAIALAGSIAPAEPVKLFRGVACVVPICHQRSLVSLPAPSAAIPSVSPPHPAPSGLLCRCVCGAAAALLPAHRLRAHHRRRRHARCDRVGLRPGRAGTPPRRKRPGAQGGWELGHLEACSLVVGGRVCTGFDVPKPAMFSDLTGPGPWLLRLTHPSTAAHSLLPPGPHQF